MGRNKKYSGYRAYQYLEPGIDYVEYPLVKEIGRIEPYIVPVSKPEEERVDQLLESLIINIHDHPILLPKNPDHVVDYTRQGRWFTAYEGLSVSGMDAVFDNLQDGISHITSKRGGKWTDVIYDLGMRLSDIAHQDFVIRGESVADIQYAHETGKVALIPTLESLQCIENEIDRIDILYGLGIRCMGVVYSESNMLASGLKEERDGGLTDLGHQAVTRMNKLGVMIDVSHASDQASLDVIEASKAPIMISHAGARALWDTNRMMPDEVLKALGAKNGIFGVEAAPHTTLTKQNPDHTIESVMEHFKYCVELCGIDNVGFGPDTLHGDHVAVHHIYSSYLSMSKFELKDQDKPKESPYVRGAENPAEFFPNAIRWLVKNGYTDEDIKKVLGGNALRVLKAAWGS